MMDLVSWSDRGSRSGVLNEDNFCSLIAQVVVCSFVCEG